MEELLNGSLEDAVRYLAKVAADRRTRPVTVREKMASPMDFLSSLGDTVKNNPTLSHALVGGGIGAGLGGLSRAYGNSDKPEGERKSLLGGLVQGGLAGAGVGAGVGATRSYLNRPAGGTGTPAADFTDPVTGDKYKTKPNVPADVIAKAKQLSSSSGQKRIAQGIGGALGEIHNEIPITSTAAAIAAPIDAAMHMPGVGLTNVNPAQATGRLGQRLFNEGLTKLKDKAMPFAQEHLMPAFDQSATHPETTVHRGPVGKSLDKLRGWTGRQVGGAEETLGERLGRTSGGRGAGTAADFPRKGMIDVSTEKIQLPTGQLDSASRPGMAGSGTLTSTTETKFKGRMPAETADPAGTITHSQIGKVRELGKDLKEIEGRQLHKVPGLGTYRGASSVPRAIGGRAALYGIPMGAEYLARGLQDDAKDKSQLRDLLAQYAEKQPGN